MTDGVEELGNIQAEFLRCEGKVVENVNVRILPSQLYFAATVFQRNVRIGNVLKRHESCLRLRSCSRDPCHRLLKHLLSLPGLGH